MSIPWFFLSYARTDAGTEHLKNFYSDLIVEVRQKAGIPIDMPDTAVGFMDTSGIEIGAAWPEEIVKALSNCRVFVCLYSRTYFTREYCGKEFQAFSERIDKYVEASQLPASRPSLILPIIWGDPRRLPKPLPHAVSHIQYVADSVSESYGTLGLYYLMRVRSRENLVEYNKLLQEIADRIVQEAEPDLLPPLDALQPLETVKDAFRLPSPGGARAAKTERRRGGPNVARFVYVAARTSELGDIREKVDCYGDEDYEWRPYHPEHDKPVGLISQSIASREGLYYEKLRVDEDFVQQLREAENSNVIVVIIVDPWSIQVEYYRNQMSEFDRREFLNCGVLIPWNERDEETNRYLGRLQTGVRTTFERKYVINPTYFRGHIPSLEKFQDDISDTLNEVRARLIKRAVVINPPSGRGHMPWLSNTSRQTPPPGESDTL
jgi:FxsC-like protein